MFEIALLIVIILILVSVALAMLGGVLQILGLAGLFIWAWIFERDTKTTGESPVDKKYDRWLADHAMSVGNKD